MKDEVFQQKIQNVMTDNKYDRQVPNQRKGKLDNANLWKVKANRENIFRQKKERKGKNYNVLFLVDESGSMGKPGFGRDDKINICADICYWLCETLNRNSINTSIIGFNGDIRTHKEFNEKLEEKVKDQMCYYANDYNDIEDYPLAKELHEKESADEHDKWYACNHDFDALNTAYEKLSKMKGGNILIVLSDGRPNCDTSSCDYDRSKHNIEEIRKLIKANKKIKTIAIGIECVEVEKIYDNHIVIKDGSSSDLKEEVKNNLINILRKEIKRQ